MSPLQSFFIREQIIKSVREFFDKLDFHEVIAPILLHAVPEEPNIFPFTTLWNTRDVKKKLFLATSPEKSLKQLLAKGIGNCYAIGHSFRNLENKGSLHNPEFLMLEWYRENADYKDIMQDVRFLILDIKKNVDRYLKREMSSVLEYQGKKINLENNWSVYSLKDLFKEHASIDLEDILKDEKGLHSKAHEKGYNVQNANWAALFDQILVNEIEPHFTDEPFFVVDFPSRLSPLCKVKQDDFLFAERFEWYIAGMELGNGNNEKIEMDFMKEHFYIDASLMQGREYAGIGLGIDRLTMLFANMATIHAKE